MNRKLLVYVEAPRRESGGNAPAIVEATVDLHAALGPTRTSISAIAERAGVQRHTVLVLISRPIVSCSLRAPGWQWSAILSG